MRSKFLFSVLIFAFGTLALGADDPPTRKDVTSRADARNDELVQAVVHSARLGEIDADTPVYRSYTNAEITDKLNQFDRLTAYERRGLLLEVRRRIERDGEFKVEKHERRFGQVDSEEPVLASDDSEELVLEEIVIHRVDSNEEEIEVTREKEARNLRPPVRRIPSGRSYSSQQ